MTAPAERVPMLHHYTSQMHLRNILADGVIRTTESNVGFPEEHAGPDVVWLLRGAAFPDNDLPHGLTRYKTTARIAVAPSGAVRWEDWPWTARMDGWWRQHLVNVGGGADAAARWWVLERELPLGEWLSVEVLDGRGLWLEVDVAAARRQLAGRS